LPTPSPFLKCGPESRGYKILPATRAEKMELLYAELSHSVPCVSRQFATKKNFTSFVYFTSPNFFPEGICLHLPMEWMLSAMLYRVSTLINVSLQLLVFGFLIV